MTLTVLLEREEMPTYREILAQIETLKQQAEELRKAELSCVIAEIRQKIADYDLTAADLGFGELPAAAEKPARGRRSTVKPKYRDPASGKTWSGRGVMPVWMKTAIEAGRAKEEFLIGE